VILPPVVCPCWRTEIVHLIKRCLIKSRGAIENHFFCLVVLGWTMLSQLSKNITQKSGQWEAINRKQITRWQHVSRLKASSFSSWKKIIIVKNATAYTWDWYCHLVVDRASFHKHFKLIT